MNRPYKKNVLRENIRRKQIQKLFESKRKMFEYNSSLNNKNQDVFPQSQQKHKKIYPILCHQFDNQEFIQLLDALPRSIEKIVETTNNHLQKAHLLIVDNIQKITSTFADTNLVQWSNYVYLVEGILLNYPEHNSAKIKLIEQTSGSILYRAEKLCNENKMAKVSVLRNYFDYLLTLGQDLIFLNPLDMMSVYSNVKKVLLEICTPTQLRIGDESQDLLNSTILLCQNILSLKPMDRKQLQQQLTQNTQMKNIFENISLESDVFSQNNNKQYECQHTKIMFLNELFKNPLTIKYLSEFGSDPSEMPVQCEQILRLLINLTFFMNDPTRLCKIQKYLIIMIQSILSQIRKNNYQISILTLRLINNVAVSDVYFCSKLAEQSILAMMIQKFGASYLLKNNSIQQHQIGIRREFISTLTSYIIMIPSQKQVLCHLQSRYHSLSDNQHHNDHQLLVRCLQAILVYINLNYEFIRQQLSKHTLIIKQVLEKQTNCLSEHSDSQTVCTMCEQIITAVSNVNDQI